MIKKFDYKITFIITLLISAFCKFFTIFFKNYFKLQILISICPYFSNIKFLKNFLLFLNIKL